MGMTHEAPLALTCVFLALLACKSDDGKSGATCTADSDCKNGYLCESKACIPKEAAEKIRASQKPVAPTVTPTAPAPSATVAPTAADDGPIPAIPDGRSEPPTSAEWSAAKNVNTQGANSWPPDCTTKLVREWLQVNCTGKVKGYEKMENFGKLHADYFESIMPGKLASFVVRLKKGKTISVRICRDTDRASLFVNWPTSKDRPVHVALGKGPVCDGK
jgi:hypothetical protein